MVLLVTLEFKLANVKCCPVKIVNNLNKLIAITVPFRVVGEDQVIVVPLSMRITSPSSKTEMSLQKFGTIFHRYLTYG